MNFIQKLDAVIEEIKSVYNMSDGQAALIKNNIIRRVKMYQNVTPTFFSEETKIINNSSDIGDFYINRLVTNIRNYNFSYSDESNKGNYISKQQTINVGDYKFIESITQDKLKRRIQNVDKETLRQATVNVLNHEIGHALQTSFKGKNGYNDAKYNQLIKQLTEKYPQDFKLQETNEPLTSTQKGMKPVHKNDSKSNIRDFYSKMSFTTHLDEIFNEDEALHVTGVNQPQLQYDMGNGFSKKIYNYQSSNYKITSYGRMMKIIMDENKTFQSMYEDSIVAYEFFDQFKDISDKTFSGSTYEGKAPMLNVLNALDKIRNNSSLDESQKLDLFFTECLLRKVRHEINNPNLNQSDITRIKTYIEDFSAQMITNPNVITKQDEIINNIKNKINELEKNLNNTYGLDNSYKINDLKSNIIQIKEEYKKMMSDGIIDTNELNDLVSRLSSLLQITNNMKLSSLSEEEKNQLNKIESIIISGLQRMNEISNNNLSEEEQTITKKGFGK